MITITTPKKSEYGKIAKLINEADKKYFEIYSKKEAEMHEIAKESVESLKEGEKTRKYLCLKYNNEIAAFVSFYPRHPECAVRSHPTKYIF